MVTVCYTINTVWNELKYVLCINDFLGTLDTGFRIYKWNTFLNTIILLDQIKVHLCSSYKWMLLFRPYKSWYSFSTLLRIQGIFFKKSNHVACIQDQSQEFESMLIICPIDQILNCMFIPDNEPLFSIIIFLFV